ncbi:hypothetical protein ACHAWF_015512, partial [Thalassiosira exigua]
LAMKIFIVADIEGIAGVTTSKQCSPGNPDYESARALMEGEVNAAVAGAFDGGATSVVVADSHGSYDNLRVDMIDPRARLVRGKPRPLAMIEGIQRGRYDGLMLIGFHSAAGEPGVLAHTINGRAFHSVKVNGRLVGEADIYAAVAGSFGTPLRLVSGDDELQGWIGRQYPDVPYACVKTMISTTAAESLSPRESVKLIRSMAKNATENGPTNISPRLSPPYALELAATRSVLADLFCLIPGVERKDARTVTFTCSEISDLIGLLSAFSYLSMASS